MPEQKTKPTEASVESFLETIADENTRDDCFTLVKMMKKVTGSKPKMWGASIVGFGSYHYKYNSGHAGFTCLTGFSPRKQNISIYLMPGLPSHPELLQKLGKYKAAKGCLYIKRLADVNPDALEKLIKSSVDHLKSKYK